MTIKRNFQVTFWARCRFLITVRAIDEHEAVSIAHLKHWAASVSGFEGFRFLETKDIEWQVVHVPDATLARRPS